MKTDKTSKLDRAPTETAKHVRGGEFAAELAAQEKLMKAAQRFALGFDQTRRWTSDIDRLTYTINSWKELAMAAMEFSEGNTATPNPSRITQ